MDASRFDAFTRRLGRRSTRRTAVGSSLAALALSGLDHLVAARDTTPAPASPAAARGKPVFMFVETFASGRGEANPTAGTPVANGRPTLGGGASFLLTLEGHTGLTVYFSDRPDRIVGATPTDQFLDTLGFSPMNPPNAALVGEFASGQGVVVLELIKPNYDPATGSLTYGAEVLGGYRGENLAPVLAEQVKERLPAEFGPAALFIDDCPAITSCYEETPEDDYSLIAYLGPVPGGPYPECYTASGGCWPCDYTSLDPLTALCKSHYNCAMCYAWH